MSVFNSVTSSLRDVDHSGRKLRSLPSTLFERDWEVGKADLQRNKLRQLTNISRLSNLTELNLSKNEITDFPLEIQELQHLTRLYMNQNNIKSIPENVLPSLRKLQFFKLSTNKLERLPTDINQCQSLKYLNLSNNCLRDLSPLVGLGELRDLYVERNQLSELPCLLFHNNITIFKANGNQLTKPPVEICAGGPKAIRSYFTMLDDSPFSVCTVKTMFLGSTMAGKSTLCRSLKKGCPVAVAETDRTVGIDISEVDRDGVRFLFWDFAGHQEYYITHHIFITANAFVILAIDLFSYCIQDPKSFNDKVSFWINNIQLQVPNSVVLLVGTHVDQCSNEKEVSSKKRDIENKVKQMLTDRKESLEQQRKNLQELEDPSLYFEQMSEIERLTEYKLTILDLVPVDCMKSEDIDVLQAHIKKIISSKNTFPFLEQTLPRCYQEVETAIQGILECGDIPPHGMITKEDLLYHLQTRHSDLDHEKLAFILQYLHRIGVIMWYMEIPHLSDLVFVKPSFLISLLKAIVRHDLIDKLKEIPVTVLTSENALQKHRKRWIEDFTEQATLSNVAVRILVRRELAKSDIDDEDLIEEIAGSRKKSGNVINLLQHFDVCLPSKHNAPLNPAASEFCPNKKWEPSNPSVFNPDGACVFPTYLTNNTQVIEMWGADNLEDINVQVYFLPEIPHGFFHRLVIKICSTYSSYWIGKDHCLFSSGSRRVLLREHTKDGDQYIEIRGKDSDVASSVDIQKEWDMVKVIMMRLVQLTEQWKGLCQYVHSPCKERGCSEYFEWTDWQDWFDTNGSKKFNMVAEAKITCRKGHTRKTELLFPVS